LVPDCGSPVVDLKLQGRLPMSVEARKKDPSVTDEAAKTPDSSQLLFPTPLSALTIAR
jgi:hypothetical protein